MFVWIALVAYLLIPTSFPVLLNGIPLAEKWEFLVFTYLCMLPLMGHFNGTYKRVRLLKRMAGSLLVILVIVKFFFPISNSLTSCFHVPRIGDGSCAWFPQTLLTPGTISRYENSLSFGGGREWQIAAFNDVHAYNVYGYPEGTPEFRIQQLRQAQTLPFSVSFRLGQPVRDLLASQYAREGWVTFEVKYQGQVGPFPFSQTVVIEEWRVPTEQLADLLIPYRNFRCHNETTSIEDCEKDFSVSVVPERSPVLEIRAERSSDGKKVVVGFGPLLKNSQSRPWVLICLILERLIAVSFALLILLALPKIALPRRIAPGVLPLVAVTGFLFGWLIFGKVIHHQIMANGMALRPLFSAGSAVIFVCIALGVLKRKITTDTRLSNLLSALIAMFVGWQLWEKVPLFNTAILLNPGDDPMLYASDALGLLQWGEMRSAHAPFHFSSKPLFLYMRALYFAIFGSAEHYYSILITTALTVVWLLVLKNTFVRSASGSAQKGVGVLRAACLCVAFASISRLLIDYGAAFSGMAFSEGPAWALAGFAFLGFMILDTSGNPVKTLWSIGFCFALCVGFRTQYAMYVPV